MSSNDKPRLKVFPTIWWGYKYTVQHLPLMLRAGLYLILFLVFEDVFIRLYIAGTESSLPEYYPVFKNVVILLIGTHYAVAWHRAIVLGELSSTILRLRGTEPFYAITAFLLWLGPNVLSWVIHSLNPNSVNKNRLIEEFGIWGSDAVGHEVLIIGG